MIYSFYIFRKYLQMKISKEKKEKKKKKKNATESINLDWLAITPIII